MERKISYITLASDLYMLLGISYIIYSMFFGFTRIGYSSLNIISINDNIATIITILEIIFSIILAYILHKCDNKKTRLIVIIICLLSIIYRVINIIALVNIFSVFMLVLGVILLFNLIFY